MGHFTSRFGKVNPQGKVIGCEISSIAVGVDDSSSMIGAKKFASTGLYWDVAQIQTGQESGKMGGFGKPQERGH